MRIETLEIGKPFRIIELLGVAVKVLFVSSETYPLAKTGGLANVSAALPKAVARLGVIFVSLSPATRCALRVASEQRPETKLDLPDAALTQLISAYLPDSGFPVWIVDSPSLFRREGGLYRDLDGRDWGDNAQRFAYLTRVAARIAVRAGNSRLPRRRRSLQQLTHRTAAASAR